MLITCRVALISIIIRWASLKHGAHKGGAVVVGVRGLAARRLEGERLVAHRAEEAAAEAAAALQGAVRAPETQEMKLHVRLCGCTLGTC